MTRLHDAGIAAPANIFNKIALIEHRRSRQWGEKEMAARKMQQELEAERRLKKEKPKEKENRS